MWYIEFVQVDCKMRTANKLMNISQASKTSGLGESEDAHLGDVRVDL